MSSQRFKFLITTEGVLNAFGYRNVKLPGTVFLTYGEVDILKENGYDVVKLEDHEIYEKKWVPLPDLEIQYINGPAGPMGPQGPIGPMGPQGISVVDVQLIGDDLLFYMSDSSVITLEGFITRLNISQGLNMTSILIDANTGDFTFNFSDNSQIVTHTSLNSILNEKQDKSEKGNPLGYASLDSDGKVPESQLPDLGSNTKIVGTISDRNNLPDVSIGDEVYVIDASSDSDIDSGPYKYIFDGSGWQKIIPMPNVSLEWNNILNKPNSLVSEIDDAVNKRHEHSNLTAIDKISEDSSNLPTWNGASWPLNQSAISHTNLSDLNGNNNYLHISKTEKDLYDGYDASILNLQTALSNALQRITDLENNSGTPQTLNISQSSLNGADNVDVNSTTYVEYTLGLTDDGPYTINSSVISTTPDNIISGSIITFISGDNTVLRIPVVPTKYNQNYVVTVGAGAITANGISNIDDTSTLFSTEAAAPATVNNSILNGNTDVEFIDPLVVEFPIDISASPNSILSIADNSLITASNATISNTIIEDGKLKVTLTGLTEESQVSVYVLAGAIDNSGVLNTTPITATFTMGVEDTSPYVWEYDVLIGTGETEIVLADLPNWNPDHMFTIEEFYGPAYDGVDKTVEVLYYGYTGNITHPNGAPMPTSVEAFDSPSNDGKVDFNDINKILFLSGSLSEKVYKVVKYKNPVTRS